PSQPLTGEILSGHSAPPSTGSAPHFPEQVARPVRAAYTPPARKPYVTYTIMGITIFIFLLQQGSQLLMGTDLPALFGMKVNEWIAQGELWRLFTPMLLHGGLLHILFNMYALYSLGPALEQHYGHGRFLTLYILAGFAGNVASLALSANPSLGASTSLFGLFGAEGVFLYQNREVFGERARAGLNQIIRLAGINLLISLAPGIDMWGHLGGLIGGTLFAWFAGPLLKVEGIFPAYSIQDRREPASVWLGAILVGAVFAGIAAGVIFLRLT
ncbi:MAG TPA: rhomboid family intramembrane serine protease, partial [Anaerolineales bacterium]|nr:rhomboid family intramembrane serine protease [Anaerolineales bacterium]